MNKIAMTALMLLWALPAAAQISPFAGQGQPEGFRPVPDETTALLREIYLIFSAMPQSLQNADEDTNRRAAKSLRESEQNLRALGDPYGVQSAMRDFSMSLSAASSVSRGASPERQQKLQQELKTIKQRLSSFVDPATLSRMRGQQGEGQAKGSLGALRSALSIYYGDKEGKYPSDLSELIPKYLTRIPAVEVAGHPSSSSVRILRKVKDMNELETRLKDTGQWLFVGDPASPITGTIVIDCTHVDSRGMKWFKY